PAARASPDLRVRPERLRRGGRGLAGRTRARPGADPDRALRTDWDLTAGLRGQPERDRAATGTHGERVAPRRQGSAPQERGQPVSVLAPARAERRAEHVAPRPGQ